MSTHKWTADHRLNSGEVHYVDFIMEQSDKDSGKPRKQANIHTYTGEGKKESKEKRDRKGKRKSSALMKLLSFISFVSSDEK